MFYHPSIIAHPSALQDTLLWLYSYRRLLSPSVARIAPNVSGGAGQRKGYSKVPSDTQSQGPTTGTNPRYPHGGIAQYVAQTEQGFYIPLLKKKICMAQKKQGENP